MTIRFLLQTAGAMLLVCGLLLAPAMAQDAGEKKAPPPADGSEPATGDKQPATEDKTAGEAKPDDTKPDDTKPDDTKPDDAKPADTKPEEEGTPAEQFTKALAHWHELETKIKAARAEFLALPVTERATAYANYNAIANAMIAALPKLREKAVAAYNAAPNEDEQVTRILIGLMADANRNDRYADARDIGQLLAAHECPEGAWQGQLGAALFCLGDFEKAAPYLKTAEEDPKTQTPLVKLVLKEFNLRQAEAKADNLPRVRLTTSKGDVVLELFENEAPGTVGNFINLVEKGFYTDLPFHRVIDGFMAQGGDPKGDGTGGPGYNIFCECYRDDHRNHFRGSLAMAHSGRDTGGSQFYITYIRTPSLDGLHTVFGRVIEGMEHIDALNRINPQRPVKGVKPDMLIKAEVIRKRDHEYKPVKVGEAGTTDTPPETETDTPKKDDTPKTEDTSQKKDEPKSDGADKKEDEAPKGDAAKDDAKPKEEPASKPEKGDDAK